MPSGRGGVVAVCSVLVNNGIIDCIYLIRSRRCAGLLAAAGRTEGQGAGRGEDRANQAPGRAARLTG